MKSLLEQIEEGFYELEETLENNDELEEISTSAGAGSYMTPNAFGKKVKELTDELKKDAKIVIK